MTANPTVVSYEGLQKAYDWFNRELFAGQLPTCLITLVNHKGSMGYFAPDKFRHEDHTTDEIALNPAHFNQGREEALATLVHEMVHLWQKHFGKMPRKGYHDKQWAQKMEAVGLIPSDTGKPGGKKTGQKMADYAEEGGRFMKSRDAFLAAHGLKLYQDVWALESSATRERSKASKTKYTCPECGANCWAKPESRFICGTCEEAMEEQG